MLLDLFCLAVRTKYVDVVAVLFSEGTLFGGQTKSTTAIFTRQPILPHTLWKLCLRIA